jgi:hypothetical protein
MRSHIGRPDCRCAERCVPNHLAVLIPCIDFQVHHIFEAQGDSLFCVLSFNYLHQQKLRVSSHTLFALDDVSMKAIVVLGVLKPHDKVQGVAWLPHFHQPPAPVAGC